MGLNARGRGRGRGGASNFQNKVNGRLGMMNQEVQYNTGPNCMFYPGTSFGGPQVFRGPEINMNQFEPENGNFLQKNTVRNQLTRNSDQYLSGTELTKPHFTQEPRYENKKQKFLVTRRKTKHTENWTKFKVLPRENGSGLQNHYCETCDKSFKTQEDLLLHKAGHETCNHDGCEFTAHPKIIAKHIKMQHESGLYKRIGNLYTEEDIAKWIEERKKRYPTRKVIEEKKILEEEKIKRGERINDDDSKLKKPFNKRNRKSWKKNFEKQSQRTVKNRRTRKKKETYMSQKILEEQTEDIRRGVPAFSGIRNTVEPKSPEKSECNISDDEWEIKCEPSNLSKTTKLLNNSLGLLAEFYNSDEENSGKELQSEITKGNISGDEGSGPEEVKTVSIKNSLLDEKSKEKKVSLKRKFSDKKEAHRTKRKNPYDQFNAQERSLTLLEKLLKKEIRHERNVILQCINYIVNHNFFKT